MPTDFPTSDSDQISTERARSSRPVPAWERNKKRRGFGSRGAAASRPSPAASPPNSPPSPSRSSRPSPTRPVRRTEEAVGQGSPDRDRLRSHASTSPRRSSAARRGNGAAAPIAIAAGIILISGLAVGGLVRHPTRHDTGVAELTPGEIDHHDNERHHHGGSRHARPGRTEHRAHPAAGFAASWSPPGRPLRSRDTARLRASSPASSGPPWHPRSPGQQRRRLWRRRQHQGACPGSADRDAEGRPGSGPAAAPPAPLVLNLPAQAAPTTAAPAEAPAPAPTQTPPN